MRIISCYFQRFIISALLVILLFCIVQVLRSELGFNDSDLSNLDKLIHISELIKESDQPYVGLRKSGADFLQSFLDADPFAVERQLEEIIYQTIIPKNKQQSLINFEDTNQMEGVVACKLPQLDVSNPEITKFLHDVPPLSCTPEDWVILRGSRLVISNKAKNKYGSISCSFSEIIREDDFYISFTPAVVSDDSYTLKNSDFVDVKCESKNGEEWHSILAGVQDNPKAREKSKWESVSKEALKLNVLMFGFDSLSRNTFIRKLPKTYQYLEQSLNALTLQGYNIVGDGTPQALIPILTGKIELELPDTRKRMGQKANHVNIYPMIWKQYKENGYITGFMEDVHHIGTFTYRLKGFKQQPTDHYMRTFYLAASPYFKYFKKYCIGGIPRHMVMLNYMKEIFNVYKHQPKFLFGFHGELSHDSYNDIGVVDEDLYNWVKDLHEFGHLNNTVLILMSDHGHRFAEIRNTLQGKQEERLPFFSFVFPPWFKKAHPQAYANFLHNTQYLTTPFDVHKTLENILNFGTPKDGDRRERAISLFDKVPIDRTCADAFIEPHWCACLSWQDISTENPDVIAAAKYFIEFLNDYTNYHRDICDILRVKEILWAAKLIPNKGLLKFHKSGDQDGFIGDFSAKTKLTSEMYQLKVKTTPGEGLFEVSITHDIRKNTFTTKISDVSRINMYGSQARCVENSLFHLRKYCHCKE